MSKTVIKVENLSKIYDLEQVGTGTLSKDLNRTWAKLRGKPDPYATLAELNDRTQKTVSGTVYALKDINFDVEQGEVLGIIGKNGAGKSTLLKILSQITSATTGDIKLRGRVASLLEVGTGMHPEMTARQNIYLNGSIMGMRRQEITAKLDEIVDFAGIGKYIDTPIKRFSSGMKVRLGFAVAAFLEPELLIVDEVLAVGDAEFQKKAIGKMQDVTKAGERTVLFVSHNMAAVRSLCTKGIVLEHGTIVFTGTSDEAVNYYLKATNFAAQKPLLEREDRKGNKKLLIDEISIENNQGLKVGQLHSGEEYSIRFNYTKYKDIDPKQLFVGAFFKNDQDETVTAIATDELGVKFDHVPDKGQITIQIPKLQFREGNYSLAYMISEKMAFNNPHEVIDNLSDALMIEVIRGDYWNSGVFNRPKGFIQEATILISKK